MCYADAGNVVHDCLEHYYKVSRDINIILEMFYDKWREFKLENTKLKDQIEDYKQMVMRGIKLNLHVTDTERLIEYDDVKAFIDVVDDDNLILSDWKTSKRYMEERVVNNKVEYYCKKDEEYLMQVLFYGWLYYRDRGIVVKKGKVYYLRYDGDLGVIEQEINYEKIKEIENWYNDILKEMEYYIENPNKLPPFNTNYMWCPYKHLWGSEEGNYLTFHIHTYGNYLKLEGDISPLLERGIKKKFSYELKNAYWIIKHNPQANTTVCFWNSKTKILPIGFIQELIFVLNEYASHKGLELKLNTTDHRQFNDDVVFMPYKLLCGRTLRDYQQKSLEIFLEKKHGILELSVGAGKTLTAAEILRVIARKSIFIVDKIELLNQTKKVFEDSLGIKIGCIGAGESDVQDITVATIQTLAKNIDKYKKYLSEVRVLVIDEFHKSASKSYQTVAKYLKNTEYRLGLTGTARRSDGEDMKMFSIVGPVIHKLTSSDLIGEKYLMKPKIYFIKDYMTQLQIDEIEYLCEEGLINAEPDYNTTYNYAIVKNQYRNNKIYDVVKKYNNKKILILTKIIDHGKELCENIEGSVHLYGDTPKKIRKEMFDDFVSGKVQVMVSTLSIFAEGIDIPSLDMVINASGNVSDVKTIQVLGRVIRKLEGKEGAYYIDFFDNFKFFKSASIHRIKSLAKENHDVKQVKII